MGIGVLGPLAVDRGESVSPRDRVVLEALVVRAGAVVDKEVLADALWGDAPPASWAKVVHGCVARLRRVLGSAAVETTPYGYRLLVHDDELDVRRFEVLVGRAREQLDSGDADRTSYLLGEALALWRGPAYPDLAEWEPGRNESDRLDDLRLTAEELRVEAEIRGGRSPEVVTAARSMVADAPLRERRWALLARALYQAGRQSDSLEVVGRARRMLRDELGLDPGPELVALEQAILRQDPGLAAIDAHPTSDLCPYPGLLPYEAEDADSFFGRDTDVGACLKLLRERGTLAIVGPSGSGKSSLVRAGIVAVLRSEGRKVLLTTPGPRPLDTLAALPQRGPKPVLVIDQAEEAVTLCGNADQRGAYFAALGGYAGELIVALRADHLGDIAAYPAFARIIERGLHLLTAMDEQNLRATIEGPAGQAGLRLEPGLSDLLVREVEGEPGALPLLSHVLRQTWENREGRTLTVDGYRRTGGVRTALAQSAETLYQGLADPQRDQIRALFLRLVMPSTDGDPVRARVPRSKVAVDSAHERLIEQLIAARLVTSDDTEIQIAHEALAREWPRLQEWLAQDVEGQQIFRHLASAAESWEQMGRPDSELYRGSRLTAAVEWAEQSGPDLTDVERRFLRDSQNSAEEEIRQTQLRLRAQVRSNRRLRAAFAVALAAALVAVVLSVVAVKQRQEARAQSDRASREARAATARALAGAAIANIGVDSERSILLAIQAARETRSVDGFVLPEAEQALHQTIAGSREAKFFTGIGVPIDVSPRGVFVAEPGEGAGVLEIRDVATGALVRRFKAQDDDVENVAFSRDGSTLATSGKDGRLNLWDPSTGVRLATFTGPRRLGWAVDVSLSSDGSVAAAMWGFDLVQVFDVHTQRRIWARGFDIAGDNELSPDGRYIAVTTLGNGGAVYDLRTGKLAYQLKGAGGNWSTDGASISWSPDGRFLASMTIHDMPRIWDAATGKVRFDVGASDPVVHSLAWSPDSTRLAVGDTTGTVKLWEVRPSGVPEEPTLSLTDQVLGVIYGVEFSGDGTHLLAAGQRAVKIWDVSLDGDAEWAHFPSAADDIPFVEFLPGGSRLLASSPEGGAVTIWDVNTRRQIRTISTTTVGVVNAAAVSTDGQVIAAGGRISQTSNANGFAAWDAATGRQRFSLHGDNVNGLAISADGRHVASVDLDGRARIVDRSGRQVSVFKVGAAGIVMLAHDDASRVSRVQFSPDGARIAVVAQNDRGRQQLEIWDWRKKTVVGRLNAGAFVDFDPTGFRVVTADGGGRGEIVNLQSGKRVAVLAAQPGSLEQAAFSPDGSLVATAGTDGAVRLFDAHTGGEQLTLPSAACPVTDVSFSQDGTKLASASLCDGVRVWALDIDDLLRIARQKVTRSLTPQECRQYLRTDRCPRS